MPVHSQRRQSLARITRDDTIITMSVESGSAPKRERIPPPENIDDLERRVRELTGSVRAKLDPKKIEELVATAQGQSQLLKMLEASKRFNERIIFVLGALSMDGVAFRILSNIVTNPELSEKFSDTAFMDFTVGIPAAIGALAVSFMARSRFETRSNSILYKL